MKRDKRATEAAALSSGNAEPSRRIQAAAMAVGVIGVIAIAPIGKTGFNITGAAAGVVMLGVAFLIYQRFLLALLLATCGILAVSVLAFATQHIGLLVSLPCLIACISALPPMWEQRRERRQKTAPKTEEVVSFTYAGFWIRTAAAIIDLVLFVVLAYLATILLAGLAAAFGAFDFNQPYSETSQRLAGPAYLLALILNILYFVGFWTLLGRTPGMMATGLRLRREGSAVVPVGDAAVRYIVFIPAALLVVGLLWPIWDRKKQAWHDKAAGTYVLRGEGKTKPSTDAHL